MKYKKEARRSILLGEDYLHTGNLRYFNSLPKQGAPPRLAYNSLFAGSLGTPSLSGRATLNRLLIVNLLSEVRLAPPFLL